MKKVLILGATGMLGNRVSSHFLKSQDFQTIVSSRTADGDNQIAFDVLSDPVSALPSGFDYVINCIGVIKPYIEKNPLNAIKINSVFPHELAAYCKEKDMRLIHITTDCVFSGRDGKYSESAMHDALDIYGKSKSLGEPPANAMLLRTSIIGLESNHFVSLISWAISQAGKTVSGFKTHFWNGITTDYYAKVCEKIILNDMYQEGLYHIHAKDDVDKFRLLHLFNEKFKLNLDIQEAYPEKVDRTMRSEKALCSELEIPTVAEMVNELGSE